MNFQASKQLPRHAAHPVWQALRSTSQSHPAPARDDARFGIKCDTRFRAKFGKSAPRTELSSITLFRGTAHLCRGQASTVPPPMRGFRFPVPA